MPSDFDAQRQDRERKIRAFQESSEDWRELTPVINVNVGREPMPTQPDSDPPATSGVAVTWKKGVRLGKLPPWATVLIALTLGIAAIVAATAAYIATH